MLGKWKIELFEFPAPYSEVMRNKSQRSNMYHYICGLIGYGERKCMQQIAERIGIPYQNLQYFITEAKYDTAELMHQLIMQAMRLFANGLVFLIIDDTALLKKGSASPGVARQYAGVVGKVANCQALVSLTLACNGVLALVGLHLFLPESWTSNRRRMDEVGVPKDRQKKMTKIQLAMLKIDELVESGLKHFIVLADAGYGKCAEFRKFLMDRGLPFIVGVPKHQLAYPADVRMHLPENQRGRKRKQEVPDRKPVRICKMFEGRERKRVEWRTGTKGPLWSDFAAVLVRVAEGAKVKLPGEGVCQLPGELVWVIAEYRDNGDVKFHLSNLSADLSLEELVAKLTERWKCEQAHQQSKDELGLDHFEGRSWDGLHRHALFTMIAFNFLQYMRFKFPGSLDEISMNPDELADSFVVMERQENKDQTSNFKETENEKSDESKMSRTQPPAARKTGTENSQAESSKTIKHPPCAPAATNPSHHSSKLETGGTKLPTLQQIRRIVADPLLFIQAIKMLEHINCPRCLSKLAFQHFFKLTK